MAVKNKRKKLRNLDPETQTEIGFFSFSFFLFVHLQV